MFKTYRYLYGKYKEVSEMDKSKDNWKFEKGKTITIKIQDSPVKITFAARKNEQVADTIKSLLLSVYSQNLC